MSDILPMDAIELGAEADSWSMAVARAGELLVKAGIAEERYISAMIDMVNKHGSYMVVAPGVAMPHSHSDKGVIRSGVSFLRLTKPVYFPGKEDQPIYLLIAGSYTPFTLILLGGSTRGPLVCGIIWAAALLGVPFQAGAST